MGTRGYNLTFKCHYYQYNWINFLAAEPSYSYFCILNWLCGKMFSE